MRFPQKIVQCEVLAELVSGQDGGPAGRHERTSVRVRAAPQGPTVGELAFEPRRLRHELAFE